MPEPTLERRIDRLEEAMADLALATAEKERDWRRYLAASERRSAESERAWRRHLALMRRQTAEWWERHDSRSAEWQAQQERQSAEWQAQQERQSAEWQAQQERQSAEWWVRHEVTVEGDRRRFAEWQVEQRRQEAAFRLEMRRASGELSRRLGTMAEDLVAPSVGRILRTFMNAAEEDVTSVSVRARRRTPLRPGEMVEFDVVAVCGDYALVNETKSRLTPADIPAFLKRLATIRDFFPELAEKRILAAIASLYVDQSLVRLGQRHGLIVLGFGEELMDVLNTPGFVPREF